MSEFILPAKDRQGAIAKAARFMEECLPGKRLIVTVKAFRKERTPPQCRYLNGVAYKLLGDAVGYDRDDISEYLCGTYWGWKQEKCPKTPSNPKGLKDVPIRTTTRDADGNRCVLDTFEFDAYKEFVQRFGAKHGVHIPDPDEEWFTKEGVK